MAPKILGNMKKLDKDVELCRTTNERISNHAARLLIENQIPFTRNWIRDSVFLREKYRGAQIRCLLSAPTVTVTDRQGGRSTSLRRRLSDGSF